ncbi:MAG: phenylalanine--tRNA ligase subunit beta [Methanospirillaceae archaeon]|nr:phenylalanine--tRNA ligase subunit beta [Methanospirillaceae archaeon]
MPIISLPNAYLQRLTGADIETIIKRLPMIGSDIERILPEQVDVEFFPCRPDLFSTEGVARAMQGFLNLVTGEEEFQTTPGTISFSVDPNIALIRPYIGSAVIRNVSLDNEAILSLMGVQEALHWVVGRGRAKVAIGVHDLDTVRPPFRYFGAQKTRSFIPLDFNEEMTLEQICNDHPKGRMYAHIVADKPLMPLIEDADGQVLSFPPIINGELTRVTEKTHNLLLDVTGTDLPSVTTAVQILCTSLITAGGTCEEVQIDGTIWPDLSSKERMISVSECNSLLGLDLSAADMAEILRRMRYDAKPAEDDTVLVSVPCYRSDIMHDWDIFEDVCIGYGYDQIVPKLPLTSTIGEEHPVMQMASGVRSIMTGMGFSEVMPFSLTNERIMYDRMQRERDTRALSVLHPISEEQTMIRTDLLPVLMEMLQLNKKRELPQRLFMIGDVVCDQCTYQKVAGVCIQPGADFSLAYATADGLMRELGLSYTVRESYDPAFIPGRSADLLVDEREAGGFGEIHPGVLNAFDLDQPVAAVELDLRVLFI